MLLQQGKIKERDASSVRFRCFAIPPRHGIYYNYRTGRDKVLAEFWFARSLHANHACYFPGATLGSVPKYILMAKQLESEESSELGLCIFIHWPCSSVGRRMCMSENEGWSS